MSIPSREASKSSDHCSKYCLFVSPLSLFGAYVIQTTGDDENTRGVSALAFIASFTRSIGKHVSVQYGSICLSEKERRDLANTVCSIAWEKAFRRSMNTIEDGINNCERAAEIRQKIAELAPAIKRHFSDYRVVQNENTGSTRYVFPNDRDCEALNELFAFPEVRDACAPAAAWLAISLAGYVSESLRSEREQNDFRIPLGRNGIELSDADDDATQATTPAPEEDMPDISSKGITEGVICLLDAYLKRIKIDTYRTVISFASLLYNLKLEDEKYSERIIEAEAKRVYIRKVRRMAEMTVKASAAGQAAHLENGRFYDDLLSGGITVAELVDWCVDTTPFVLGFRLPESYREFCVARLALDGNADKSVDELMPAEYSNTTGREAKLKFIEDMNYKARVYARKKFADYAAKKQERENEDGI